MNKKNIYVAQIGTDSNINFIPLSAGLLVSRLKQEKELLDKYNICEIIFRREEPKEFVSKIENVAVAGFSCYIWNINHSLEMAKEIKNKFPDALIVLGGPSIPQEAEDGKKFLEQYMFADIICIGEGEEIFSEICKHHSGGKSFEDISGIIYRDNKTAKINYTSKPKIFSLEKLPSPYLDGTFDELYAKYSNVFSGIILEITRGCPYKCAYCAYRGPTKIREKSLSQLREEIEWIGKHKINYIAMPDSNFGICDKDLEFAKLLAECKKKYGVPNFISVSWAKGSSERVLKISRILKESGIGFRVTLSLQSLNEEVLKAVNRVNIKMRDFYEIKEAYRKDGAYSYCELMLPLPLETYDSFLAGIENSLSESIFDQVWIYPFFLLPNTELWKNESRKKYGIETKEIECGYTKRKVEHKIKEKAELVVGTNTMPKEKWKDAFIIASYTLALHDDRLAFFILNYLKKEFGIKITDLVEFARKISSSQNNLPVIKNSFLRLEKCVLDTQNKGKSQLIEPEGYNSIPFDATEAIFLELLLEKEKFYLEFMGIVEEYLKSKNINFNKIILEDLFKFQNAVMAHPDANLNDDSNEIELKYNWIDYFGFVFQLEGKELKEKNKKFKVVDFNPSQGDKEKFLKNHFDIRGVPAFNLLYDNGKEVFPPVKLW